jgi:hypothetical protein
LRPSISHVGETIRDKNKQSHAETQWPRRS